MIYVLSFGLCFEKIWLIYSYSIRQNFDIIFFEIFTLKSKSYDFGND